MPKSRPLRFLAYAAAGVLGAVCLIAVFVVIAARSDWGRSWVATTIEQAASTPDEQRLGLGRIEGNLLGAFSIDEIILGDRDGDWLLIRALAVSWSPAALLRSRQCFRVKLTQKRLSPF